MNIDNKKKNNKSIPKIPSELIKHIAGYANTNTKGVLRSASKETKKMIPTEEYYLQAIEEEKTKSFNTFSEKTKQRVNFAGKLNLTQYPKIAEILSKDSNPLVNAALRKNPSLQLMPPHIIANVQAVTSSINSSVESQLNREEFINQLNNNPPPPLANSASLSSIFNYIKQTINLKMNTNNRNNHFKY